MAQEQNNKDKIIDLKVVYDKFQASLLEGDDANDVDIRLFWEGIKELSKFLALVGPALGFINNDLTQKIDYLELYLLEFVIAHLYRTVKTMINHEKKYDLVNTDQYISGCRALLRTQEGLEFILSFLKKIGDLQDQETTSVVCKEIYNETLSKNHSFIVKNWNKFAMYFLPSKERLLKKVFGDDVQQAINVLPKTLEVCTVVQTRIKTLYIDNDISCLP